MTKRRMAVLLLSCVVIGAGVFVLRNTDHDTARWLPKCMLFQATGLHCPGCGTTRALRALAFGDFPLAVRCNPMLVIGGPIIAALLTWQSRREKRTRLAAPKLSWGIFIVFAIYFVARNLPTPSTCPIAPPRIEVEPQKASSCSMNESLACRSSRQDRCAVSE